jgi:hypothetical protein
MASVRQLKKDIDNQVFEVIADCLLYLGLNPKANSDDITGIIEDAVSLRNDLILRTNNPVDKTDPKNLRKHFKEIESDLNAGIDKLCVTLSSLSSKKK